VPRKAAAVVDFGDAIARIASEIKAQSTRPNIFGYKPHDKQIRFHSRTGQHGLYIGGNRAGKTVAGICEDIWWLTGTHPYRETPPPPVRGRIVGVDFLNGIEKILRPELARWLPPSELEGGSWDTAYNKSTRTLTLANGSFVEFMSYDQDVDKFAGTSRHFVHFDEEPPEDIFDECKARLIDTGGSWWMTLTPVEGMDWIHDKIYMKGLEDVESGISVVEVSMTENPYLHQGEVASYIAGLATEDDKNVRVGGKFIKRGGLIFKDFDVKIHVVDYFTPPKDWLWIASLDHGFNNPTAWLWHAVGPDGQIVTFFEHYESGMVIEDHAKVVHKINAKLGRPPEVYVADPSTRNTDPISGTSIAQEYTRLGVPLVMGNNDVAAGIERMASYLKVQADGKPNWYITRNCTNLIYEFGRYTWKVWANKRVGNNNNLQEVPRKKEDHALDSARYFIMSRPELAALKMPGASPMGNIMNAPVGINPYAQQTRGEFYEKEISTEWDVTLIDEEMGGYY
jgi:phage terminase large subunit-like protein